MLGLLWERQAIFGQCRKGTTQLDLGMRQASLEQGKRCAKGQRKVWKGMESAGKVQKEGAKRKRKRKGVAGRM